MSELAFIHFWPSKKLSHLWGVWRSRQHHVNRAARKKFHTRGAEVKHRLLSARGEQRSTAQNVLLPGSRDGGQEALLAGFCGGQEAITQPEHPVYSLAVVGQLEVVLAWSMAYRTYRGQQGGEANYQCYIFSSESSYHYYWDLTHECDLFHSTWSMCLDQGWEQKACHWQLWCQCRWQTEGQCVFDCPGWTLPAWPKSEACPSGVPLPWAPAGSLVALPPHWAQRAKRTFHGSEETETITAPLHSENNELKCLLL